MSIERRKLLTLAGLGVSSLVGLGFVNRAVSAGSAAEPAVPATSPSPSSSASAAEGGGVLVVFFSRIGENYPDLMLEVGNTAQVAGFINDRVGGSLHEIKPRDPYPASYRETTDVARTEMREHIYREPETPAPDTQAFDTIFVGFPCWWGEPPMMVQKFIADANFAGRTVVPFTTHHGSGLGNARSLFQANAGGARILDAYVKRGVEVAANPEGTRTEVDAWLTRIGF